MRRLAIFAEGNTEILFIRKLIEEIAGEHQVIFEEIRIAGGTTCARRLIPLSGAKAQTNEKFYVLLLDCGGDHQVKSRILEEHERLTNKGYSMLIGSFDVRPRFTYADIPRLESHLSYRVKTKLAPVIFVLQIMEIESWFLSESTHFARIDPSITVDAIKSQLGFDPENDDMQRRPYPSQDLDACYRIAGKAYLKKKAQRTTDALDYTIVYTAIRAKISYLNKLISALDSFLS